MRNIWKIFRLSVPVHRFMLLAAALIAVQAILQQGTPITLKFVVDELSLQISVGQGDFQRVFFLFGLILAINVANVLITSLNARLGDYISSRLGKYLTELYYRKIFTLPQTYFDGEISGKIVNQLNRGILSIQGFVGTATNFIVPALLQAVFGVGVLAYYDIKIGLLALSVFPVYILISSYSTKRWGKIQEVKNVHEDETRGRIAEAIGNIKLVKTYNTQQAEWNYVSGKYKTITQLYDKQSTQYHILNFIREFGLEAAFVFIFFLIFKATFLQTLTLGEMILVIQLLNQLRWPLFGMSYILEQVQRAEADSKAFFEVLDLKGSEAFFGTQLAAMVRQPTLRFDHVSFSYEQGEPVLNDLSFKLDKQETVALVGNSGAGKTTLINLILRLYEPTEGAISLGSKAYASMSHAWVRQHMALVFQDNELFSSTVRENVAYGAGNVSDSEIWSALEQANAKEFVEKFKDGLDAQIGERGVKLSGGQKQRLQIARAILHDKPILILDEATSSLDSKSEKLVQDALEKLFQKRLVIIIAHRFSTIQNVDRIVVLENGKIADQGTPTELASRKGLYSELLSYQVKGNKKLLKSFDLY